MIKIKWCAFLLLLTLSACSPGSNPVSPEEKEKLMRESDLILTGTTSRASLVKKGEGVDAWEEGPVSMIPYLVPLKIEKVEKGRFEKPTMGIALHSFARTLIAPPWGPVRSYRVYLKSNPDGKYRLVGKEELETSSGK